jgi:hypothetical protein
MRQTAVDEKRRAPRMPVKWPVRARVLGSDDTGAELVSFNVSKTGLGLNSAKALEKDAVIKLEFMAGDGSIEMHAYAFVAWTTALGQAGLRFITIDETDENRLADMVERFTLGRSRLAVN